MQYWVLSIIIYIKNAVLCSKNQIKGVFFMKFMKVRSILPTLLAVVTVASGMPMASMPVMAAEVENPEVQESVVLESDSGLTLDNTDESANTGLVVEEETVAEPAAQADASENHTHVYHIAYNEVDHWRECTCGVSTTPMAHAFRWVTITEPTTSLTGFERGTCSTCGYVIEKEIPKKSPDHVHEYQITYDETSHWRRCSCGAKTDSNPHHFFWATIQEPGKYIAGLERGTCTVCGYTVDRSIPSTHWTHPDGPNGPGGSNSGIWDPDGSGCWIWPGGRPGCMYPFYHHHPETLPSTYSVEHDESCHWTKCVCGAITTKEFHTYSWSVVTDATEFTNGKELGTCTVCGYQIERTTPKKTHVHVLSYVEPKNATCTTMGRIGYYVCSRCHLLYADPQGAVPITEGDTVVRALGHDMKYVEALEATCTKNGHMPYYSCTTCKKLFKDENGANEVSQSNVLTKKAHNFVGSWKHNSQQHWQVCSDCTKTGNIADHTFKLVNARNADLYNEAYTGDKKCTVCGAVVKQGKKLANTVIVSAPRKVNKVTVNLKRATNASGYQVYLSTSRNGKYTRKLTLTSNSVTTGTISGLKPTTTYYVKARSYVNANGKVYYGKFTSPMKLTKALGNSKIKKVTIHPWSRQVKIDITRAAGASGYEVWSCDIEGGKFKKRMTFDSNTETQGIMTVNSHNSHYVKVRPFVKVGGKKYYGSFSKVKRFLIYK